MLTRGSGVASGRGPMTKRGEGVGTGRPMAAMRYYAEGINNKQLGRRIKEERKRMKLTQEELSERVGVTPAFIGHIERAERNLSLETLVKLCNALGVTIDFLLTETLHPKDDDVTREIRDMLRDKTIHQKAAILDIMRTVTRNI